MSNDSGFKLKIGTPCHENWANMEQEERGRFCLACQKTVVDFTNMNEEQIVAFFEDYAQRKQNTTGICGRFRKSQLQQRYPLQGAAFTAAAPAVRSQKARIYSLLAAAMLALTAPNLQAAATTTAQPQLSAWTAAQAPIDPLGDGFFADMMRMARQLHGTVVNEQGKPLAGVTVYLSNTQGEQLARVKSDKKGKFIIPLNAQIQKSSGELYLSAEHDNYIGSLAVKVSDFNPDKPVQLQLTEELHQLMGDVMIED